MARKLSTKQVKAIAAMLTESTTEKAAKKAGVSYRTVARWLANAPAFQAALAEAEAQCIAEAARLISGGAVEAVTHFRAVLNNKKTTKHRQDRAANMLLRYVDKLRLLGSIEDSIRDLQNDNT